MPRLLLLFAFTLTPLPAGAAEKLDPLTQWPHWRGPLANGSAPGATPPLKWDAATNVAWKAAVPGRGASTPIVWGDQVFLLTAIDTGKKADPKDLPAKADPKFEKKTTAPDTYHQFVVLAYDRGTGKELWRRTVAERVPHEGHHFSHSYAAGSPTTDGKRLYLSFGSFGVYCLGLDGKPVWSRDLGRMETRLGWGEASTPAVHDGKVFLTWDHEGKSFITALDADTGKTLWKVDRDEPTSWATPLVVSRNGRTQVVTPGTRQVRSYDAADGKVLWTSEGLTVNCIPSPLLHGDEVIVMAGYRGSKGASISLDASGDVTGSDKVRWTISKATPYVPSPTLAGDRLWFTQTNEGILTSVDVKTGKVVIDRARLNAISSMYASPLAAAGRLYLTSREGVTVVLRQADKLETLAVNRLGEAVDASPVAVGRQLFLRGDKHLWCFEEK
jgi:outer membrane protein assembly factor BamB